MFGALKRGRFRSLASLILVMNVVGELQRKRIAASRGFLATARLSCFILTVTSVEWRTTSFDYDSSGSGTAAGISGNTVTFINIHRVLQKHHRPTGKSVIIYANKWNAFRADRIKDVG